jgi:alpha-D-ribose 1-methylphosphonate 5-triphosphate synthase subunit PhnG
MNTTERSLAAADVAAAPRAELEALGARLGTRHRVRLATVPQDGLYLLTMEDGIYQERFFLGEIPVATAVVELDTPAGTVRGGASLMAATVAQAEAAAVCDVVLAHRLDGCDEVAALRQLGAVRRHELARQRAAMTVATRVSFSDLSDGDIPAQPGATR